jgi:hypothetical protein
MEALYAEGTMVRSWDMADVNAGRWDCYLREFPQQPGDDRGILLLNGDGIDGRGIQRLGRNGYCGTDNFHRMPLRPFC